ncbi:hypothetical protein O0882_08880 [Janthinobacterium sp. SUN073]|uniref:hypothetical protein n=1 Tax=Janthinobacterium sp. SUN073 TaxID=3004102 RepID=UPI0025AF4D8C|nr:hypothetical protein [Janthinobacterium sp. SUN073]MDN2696430.1 hypothetical protein [Janthinobacterium sp. SUN073]
MTDIPDNSFMGCGGAARSGPGLLGVGANRPFSICCNNEPASGTVCAKADETEIDKTVRMYSGERGGSMS